MSKGPRMQTVPWSPLDVAMALALTLLGCSVALFLLLSRGVYLADDVFILLTYARNLAEGLGPVFNAGERIWGYTSPLQTGVLALIHLLPLGSPENLFAAVAAISAVELTLAALFLAVLLRNSCGPLAFVAATLLLLHPMLSLFHGLESTLVVFCQCAALWLLQLDKPRAAAFVAALACLARPDAVLYAAGLFALDRRLWRAVPIACFAVPGLLWVTFTTFYYGHALPNTLGAKAGIVEFPEFWGSAARWILDPALPGTSGTEGWVWAAVLLTANLSCWGRSSFRRMPTVLFCLTIYPWLLITAYALIGPPIHYRWEIYSAHFFFLAGALFGAASALHWILNQLSGARQVSSGRGTASGSTPRAGVAAAAIVLLLGATAVRLPHLLAKFDDMQSSFYFGERYGAYRFIAQWYDHHVRGPSPALGHYEVGTLGYFTHRARVVDLAGLVTPRPTEATGIELIADLIAAERPSHILRLSTDIPRYLNVSGVRYRAVHDFPSLGYTPFTLFRNYDYRVRPEIVPETPARAAGSEPDR